MKRSDETLTARLAFLLAHSFSLDWKHSFSLRMTTRAGEALAVSSWDPTEGPLTAQEKALRVPHELSPRTFFFLRSTRLTVSWSVSYSQGVSVGAGKIKKAKAL